MKTSTLYKGYDYAMVAGAGVVLAGGVGLVHQGLKAKDFKVLAMGGAAIVAALYVAKSISMICYIDDDTNGGENPTHDGTTPKGGGRGNPTTPLTPNSNADIATKLSENIPALKGLDTSKLSAAIVALPAADKTALVNSVEHGEFGNIDLKVSEELGANYLKL